jgi:hypothetical protein
MKKINLSFILCRMSKEKLKRGFLRSRHSFRAKHAFFRITPKLFSPLALAEKWPDVLMTAR